MHKKSILFVGLGNVGEKYSKTLHNIGFMVLDILVKEFFPDSSWKKGFAGEYLKGAIGDFNVFLFKPGTLMNNSGVPVAQICRFFKIFSKQIIAIHDDIDLDFLKVKLKLGGGSAGHNGLNSMDSCVGKNYFRFRIGVGRSSQNKDVSSHVLSKFTKKQIEDINLLGDDICRNLKHMLSEDGIDINMFSTRLAEYRSRKIDT